MRKVKTYVAFREGRQAELFGDPPPHVGFIDAVRELSVKKRYIPTHDIESRYASARKRVSANFDAYALGDNNRAYWEWLHTVDRDNLVNFVDDGVKADADDEGMELFDYVSNGVIGEMLNDKGEQDFRRKLPKIIDGMCESMLSAVSTTDETGYVRVWRAIELSGKNVYEDIVNLYGGVGIYWAYEMDHADSHGAAQVGELSVLLSALATPASIDWERTIGAACSDLDEYEVTMKKGAHVLVTGVRMRDNASGNSVEKDFGGGLLVPVGTSKS